MFCWSSIVLKPCIETRSQGVTLRQSQVNHVIKRKLDLFHQHVDDEVWIWKELKPGAIEDVRSIWIKKMVRISRAGETEAKMQQDSFVVYVIDYLVVIFIIISPALINPRSVWPTEHPAFLCYWSQQTCYTTTDVYVSWTKYLIQTYDNFL